jgi:hypothetical protein
MFPRQNWGIGTLPPRVSFETSFDLKQPKLEPKLVSALFEIKRFFRLFRFYIKTASFGVSVQPKLTETERNKPKQNETNRNKQKTKDRTRPSAASFH